ncbi:MAG: hypothetical protein ACT4QD_05280 [Acidobacteriota bacterium]
MSHRLHRRLWPVLVLAAALSGCGDNTPLTPTTPSTPTTFTLTFSGTIVRNGAATHTFSTQASGTVTATLAKLEPDADDVEEIIGMSLGTWNGATCQIVLANDRASKGAIIVGGVSSFGNLCLRLYDVGTIATAQGVTYEVAIVHP